MNQAVTFSRLSILCCVLLIAVELAGLFAGNGPINATQAVLDAAQQNTDTQESCRACSSPESGGDPESCQHCVLGWFDILKVVVNDNNIFFGWLLAFAGVLIAATGIRRATLLGNASLYQFMKFPFISAILYAVSVFILFPLQ